MTVCTFLSCTFQRSPYWVGGKTDVPPFCILPWLARSAFRPLIIIFTRCISTPCMFAFAVFSAMFDMDIYSRDPIRSWGSFYILMSPTFSEEPLKWLANFLNHFRVIWRLCYVRYLRGSLPLPPYLWVSYRLSGGASFWGISNNSIFSLVLGVISEVPERTFSLSWVCPRNSSLGLLFSLSLDQ